MSNAVINIPGIHFLESGNFLLIAGPCVVESEKIVLETAEHLVKLSEKTDNYIKSITAQPR